MSKKTAKKVPAKSKTAKVPVIVKKPSMTQIAAEVRKAFEPRWAALKAKHPAPDAIVAGPFEAETGSDVAALLERLAAQQGYEKSSLANYAKAYEKGVHDLNDWSLVPHGDEKIDAKLLDSVEENIAEQLLYARESVQKARTKIAALKARIAELQGALVPAVTKVPVESEATEKKRKTESLRDVEWLTVKRAVLEACLFCAAKDDVRFYLNSVLVHSPKKGDLRVAATNGHTLLVHTTAQKDSDLPEWTTAGVMMPRDELAIALSALGKVKVGDEAIETVQIGYGANHQHVIIRDAGQFATFRLAPVNGKFPEYGKVLENSARVLEGGEREALSSSSIDRDYVKQASAIAAKFDAKGITPYIGTAEDSPIVVTFSGVPGALMVVMPVRVDAQMQMPLQTLSMMGKGLAGTATALKAHLTRQKKALSDAGNDAAKTHARESIARLESRLADVARAMGEKLLEAPKPKAEAKAVAVPKAGAAVH